MKRVLQLSILLCLSVSPIIARPHVVLMTDFGLEDGAVCQMKGVIATVGPTVRVADLTHHIPQFDIWSAAHRLRQTMRFWPGGTIFVSVVDPGVGTERTSVVAEVKDRDSGRKYLVVTPNNGTLTMVAAEMEILRAHELEESKNRLPAGYQSNTFHGRDLYAYTGARLATGELSIEWVGRELEAEELVVFDYQKGTVEKDRILGTIHVLDPNFGNVWSNVPRSALDKLGIVHGTFITVKVTRRKAKGQVEKVWSGEVLVAKTFGSVGKGKTLGYVNSQDCLALGINQGNFAQTFKVGSGPEWRIEITRAAAPAHAPESSPGDPPPR